ncbi:MAG: UDP-N-acetylmuramoyl-tripeptide--D-alanyl-D-alanine ligase [Methylophilaceae bacterium]|nr:UDP-N-acetylmuramoyl-tripeptide--D-alanyl-D-alanine ligase [Methyloradius sp.]
MMTLSEVVTATRGKLLGHDAVFDSIGTDSRALVKDQLFVALRGENFDGHDYAEKALQQGAAGVMVSDANLKLDAGVLVKDTRLGLGELAAHWRNKFDIPVAAITGSSGKTTVKEMLATILVAASSADEVLATKGNFNNDIGLPLTLFQLKPTHRYAVIEMGMNHIGEISYLTKIGRPTVALVNNAGTAHIANLGSVEAIALAKGEIFEGLAEGGVAVINADDTFASLWKKLASKYAVTTFGLTQSADVSASFSLNNDYSDIQLKTPKGDISLQLPAAGEHNVRNALAATAAALAMGVSLEKVAAGLAQFKGAKGRLQQKRGINGALVIDDTYNANPASIKAAIDVLAARSENQILVLGDMGELGDEAASLHAEIGRYAKASKIPALYLLGDLSRETAKAFGAGAHHFDSVESLSASVKSLLNPQTAVLVKGSRFMQMERVVEQLLDKSAYTATSEHAKNRENH